MSTHTRLKTAIAAALVFGLTACDKAPLSNSTVPGEDAQAAQTAGQATFGNLIAALNNITVQIDRLNALNDLTIGDVNVVNVEDVLNGNNVEALNNALNRNDVDITVLRDFLNNSLNNLNVQILNDALNNLSLVVGQVVAIDVLSGGDVNVFVQT
jgi:hypothetical protein